MITLLFIVNMLLTPYNDAICAQLEQSFTTFSRPLGYSRALLPNLQRKKENQPLSQLIINSLHVVFALSQEQQLIVVQHRSLTTKKQLHTKERSHNFKHENETQKGGQGRN